MHDRVWRKRDNPEKRVSLFKVQRVPDGEFQTFQASMVFDWFSGCFKVARLRHCCCCYDAHLIRVELLEFLEEGAGGGGGGGCFRCA